MINELEYVLQNFDEENIDNIRKNIETPQNTRKRKIYTLVQDNAPCDVVIKETSRKKCVDSLLK